MHIDPKIEPWLRKLLDGVESSNHSAEVVATTAYVMVHKCGGLTDVLERAHDICDSIGDGAPDDSPLALDALQLAGEIRAMLSGEATP